jgi:hypothetical protein
MEIVPVMEFDNIETVKRRGGKSMRASPRPGTTVENEVAAAVIKAIQLAG